MSRIGLVEGVAGPVGVRHESSGGFSGRGQQVISFAVRPFTVDGRPVPPVPVDLRSKDISGPMPAAGTRIQVHGRMAGGVFQGTEVVNLDTGAVTTTQLTAYRRPAGWIGLTALIVAPLVLVLAIGFVIVHEFPRLNLGVGMPFGAPVTVTLTPDRGPRTGKIRVAGTGFRAGEQISVTVAGYEITHLPAGPKGDFSTTITLPDAAPCPTGQCDFMAAGKASLEWQTAEYTIS